MTKPNNSSSSRPSRSVSKPVNGSGGGGGGKKPLRAVRALKQPDNSVLRPPLETSVAGLRQAVRLFETSTPEVVHLMSYECDIIYECRVCKNLFRSVANFISHKRIYCTRRFNHVQNSQVVEDHTLLMGGGGGGGVERVPPPPPPPIRMTARQDLTSIVEQASMAQYYRDAEDKVAHREHARLDATVHLQPIDNTTYGVYQTYETPGAKNASTSLMKDQVSELHNIMMMKEGVTLGPDGKILPNGSRITPDSPETPEKVAHSGKSNHCNLSPNEEHILSHHEHICGICKNKFSSKKTLSHHTRNVHGSFRVAYTCPCCINLFTNPWSVHRHLTKVHRKTNDQIRRLRPQIQKKQVHTDKLVKKYGDASKVSPPGNSTNSTNKRLAETPDKSEVAEVVKKGSTEVLRCAGCRRQFERQAAFHSHTQICHKRMAICGKDAEKSKMATPKPQNSAEKRIGIQVRMNYCKSATASPSPSPVATVPANNTSPKSRRSDRHKNDSCDRAPLAQDANETVNRSRQNSKDRTTAELVTESGPKASVNGGTPSRGKVDSKLKAKKIESISRLLMEAIGTREETTNCSPIINGVEHFDDDKNLVPKSNDAGDKCSRSSRASSCSAVVSGDNNANNKCADVERSSRLSRTRTVRLSVDTNVSSKEGESVAVKSPENCAPLVVEVNGIHPVSSDDVKVGEGLLDDEQGQLSPSKEGVIRVLTRYQLKSICKKDTDVSVKKEEEGREEQEEEEKSVVVGEPEEMQIERLREMFRSNIHYKTLQCLVCHEKMKNIIDLKNHVADHFGCNHFRCTFGQCSFVTFAHGECVRHVMRAHLKQSERHLAAGYIGSVDKTAEHSIVSQQVDQSAEALEKSSAARRKRSVPLKKDPLKSGNAVAVKQESVADSVESETSDLKAKGGKSAKRRKLANAEPERLPPAPQSTSSTTTSALHSADIDDSAQSQPEKVVEMTEMSDAAEAESDEEEATQKLNNGEAVTVTKCHEESPRSFRGFDDCSKEEVARMESLQEGSRRRSLGLGLPAIGDNCNIRTMVMNVIFGPDHVTNSTK